MEGLVEIAITDGLRLFSGESEKATARGVEWNSASEKWNNIQLEIGISDVIPRVDPYYFKIFIMAERLLAGKKFLSI